MSVVKMLGAWIYCCTSKGAIMTTLGFTQMSFSDLVPSVLAHVVTILSAAAAAWWFFFTASFRKRIEFDLDHIVVSDPSWAGALFVELIFVLRNKGQVENQCYTLAYEVVSVDKTRTRQLIKRSGNIVPSDAQYYYVRAGVTQHISSHLWIPAGVAAIRVKAFMLYDKERHDISVKEGLFSQMTRFDDWTSLDRVLPMSTDASRLNTPHRGSD
jgi:hypothetical protein